MRNPFRKEKVYYYQYLSGKVKFIKPSAAQLIKSNSSGTIAEGVIFGKPVKQMIGDETYHIDCDGTVYDVPRHAIEEIKGVVNGN